MLTVKARGVLIGVAFLSIPASNANAFEFLDRMLGLNTTANYAPAVAGGTCCPRPTCCARPTVCYMPQTCYRTVYQLVPVTACYPTTVCDPCTGCPRTVMRPVTTYVTQARVVPYTSYRPVVTAN